MMFDVGRVSVEQARALVKNAPDVAARVKSGQPLSDHYEEHQRRDGSRLEARAHVGAPMPKHVAQPLVVTDRRR
jgi:hypothetical protein